MIDEVIPLALIISELNEKMSGLLSESYLCLESDWLIWSYAVSLGLLKSWVFHFLWLHLSFDHSYCSISKHVFGINELGQP